MTSTPLANEIHARLIGALTPLSEAVQHSGGTGLIAHALSALLLGVPALLALGVIMIAAMATAPPRGTARIPASTRHAGFARPWRTSTR